MSYQAVEQMLRSVPEEDLDEIAAYIESVRRRFEQNRLRNNSGDAASYFGSLKSLGDGLSIQRKMRDEWA